VGPVALSSLDSGEHKQWTVSAKWRTCHTVHTSSLCCLLRDFQEGNRSSDEKPFYLSWKLPFGDESSWYTDTDYKGVTNTPLHTGNWADVPFSFYSDHFLACPLHCRKPRFVDIVDTSRIGCHGESFQGYQKSEGYFIYKNPLSELQRYLLVVATSFDDASYSYNTISYPPFFISLLNRAWNICVILHIRAFWSQCWWCRKKRDSSFIKLSCYFLFRFRRPITQSVPCFSLRTFPSKWCFSVGFGMS
jgi:hypothetical protein